MRETSGQCRPFPKTRSKYPSPFRSPMLTLAEVSPFSSSSNMRSNERGEIAARRRSSLSAAVFRTAWISASLVVGSLLYPIRRWSYLFPTFSSITCRTSSIAVVRCEDSPSTSSVAWRTAQYKLMFLDQTLGWALVSHAYLTSFLHRSILVWFFAAITMIVVSLLTAPPPEYKTEGNVFASAAGQSLGGTDYRIWAGVLFVCTLILWWTFRSAFSGNKLDTAHVASTSIRSALGVDEGTWGWGSAKAGTPMPGLLHITERDRVGRSMCHPLICAQRRPNSPVYRTDALAADRQVARR